MAKEKEEVTEEVTEPSVETEEEETEEAPLQTETDYEAERLAEEERRADPEKAKEAFKERKEKREKEEVIEEDDDDKPMSRREARELFESQQRTVRKDLSETTALQIARSMSSNDSEVAAIIAKWRNRSFPESMPLQEQMEEMYVAVNRKKILATNKELSRALRAKDGVTREVVGTHRDAPQGSAPRMSAADASAYKQSGFEWDGSKRLYKKSLAKGKKTLWKNPSTGKTWIT